MKAHIGKLDHAVRVAIALFLVLTLTAVQARDDETPAADSGAASSGETFTYQPISTESPRQTLSSFIRLTWLLESALQHYAAEQTRANYNRITLLTPRFLQLIDLSGVPRASRREVGQDTAIYLLDIIGRQELPPLSEVPDEAALVDDSEQAKWRIPGTPIRIVEIGEAPREGEFLFSSRTVDIAPWLYQRIRQRPLRTTLDIESWNDALPQLHGPMIPLALTINLPDGLKVRWLGTPVWKILAVVLVFLVGAILLIVWHRFVSRWITRQRITVPLLRLLSPLAVIALTLALRPFIAVEIDVAGHFAQIVDVITTAAVYFAAVWAFWLVVVLISEWIILSPKIPDTSLDANLLRLSARVVGFIGGVLILAYGAQDVGLPVLGLMAGLGVGGLAVALAIRPTFENLIGGAILYIDRPVRIGDYCSFGAYTGTVENIGVRSTQIRTRDRTLVTVPNANFANMEINNWARCDKMMIRTTIGVRYETSPDQLRYLLSGLRNMCYAHPKIEPETVRIRYIGYGPSSRDIDFRVYALTREWNEFFSIREDVFLRVDDIVAESGTSFAYPSQTLYMGHDDGLDEERSENAEKQVSAWRDSGNLPFPGPTEEQIDQLADTLDFPPRGSLGSHDPQVHTQEAVEPLSAADRDEVVDEERAGESESKRNPT